MNLFKKYFLFILVTISICLSESGYNTIYLMEFDNLKNNSTYTNLKKALPELIIENYSFRHDLTVEYIQNINPYIEKYIPSKNDSIKAFIINGQFETKDDKFYIEFEAYDAQNWNQLVKREIYCPLHDIVCVHDAFLISIEKSISPFLIDKVDIDFTRHALQHSANQITDHTSFSPLFNNIDSSKIKNEKMYSFEKNSNFQNSFSEQFKREFNLTELIPKNLIDNQNNEQNLEKILEQVFTDPYDIFIDEMKIELDPKNSEMIIVELPIEYSMVNLLSQELLSSIPYKKYVNENDDVIIQFSKEDFIFNQEFMRKIALTKFQIMPIIYLHDKLGNLQSIIIDSWDNKLEDRRVNNVFIYFKNQFSPLFAITPGIDTVQLSINTGTLYTLYSFSIPYEKIGDYTKVTVKFMDGDEVEKLLENTLQGGVN